MKPMLVIITREFKCFAGSDRGVFVVYGILVVLWSLLYLSRAAAAGSEMVTLLWAMTFAVVTGGNFAQTTYLTERVNGALEILLTCGISRRAIIGGKTLFVILATLIIGYACLGLAMLWNILAGAFLGSMVPIGADVFVVYGAAAFLNAAMSSWLSVLLPNPRMLHFVNLGFMVMLLAVFYLVTAPLNLPPRAAGYLLTAILTASGTVFLALGVRAYDSEGVIAPVTL